MDAAIKSFFVLGVAAGLQFSSRRASAATRHLVWFLAMASLLCLPFISAFLPAWQKPLWTISTSPVSGNQVAFALQIAPESKSPPPLQGKNGEAVRTLLAQLKAR